MKKTSQYLSVRSQGRTNGLSWLGYALATSGALGVPAVSAAAPQAAQGTTAQVSSADARVIPFKIAAGTLEAVLAEFQRATGLKVTTATAAIGAIQSPGVAGSMTMAQAMDALLAGTGVKAQFTQTAVSLDVRDVAYKVTVTGQTTVPSPKYTQPLRDTPQTITVIPQQVFNQQAATSLREVLRNTPGVTMSIGEGGSGGTSSGDNVLIRGFSARNDIYVDGTRDVGLVSRDTFNVESVEVTKGPASVTAGRGATGGAINLTTKFANLWNAGTVRLTGGTADNKRAELDVNRALNRSTAFRLNAMWQDSGYAGRDVAKNASWGLAPSLGFGLGGRTSLLLNYSHLQQDNVPDWGIPTLLPDVAIAQHITVNDLDWHNFYGIASRDYEKTRSDLGTATLSYKINRSSHVRNLTRVGKNFRDLVATPPRPATTVAGQGSADPGYDVTKAQIRRTDTKYQNRDDRLFTNQTDLQGTLKTFGLTHDYDLGAEITREHQPAYARTDLFTYGRPPVTDLFAPTPFVTYTPNIQPTGATTDGTADTNAIYLFDTIKTGKFQFDLGVRQDHVKADYTNVTAAPALVKTQFTHTDNETTGRAGVVYKPTVMTSLYGMYSNSFYPSFDGTLGITMAAAGVNASTLEPERMKNLEAGFKWERNLMLFSVAAFNMEKTNTRTVDLSGVQVLAGDQRVRGVEFGLTGNITSRWGIFSGLSLMHGEVIASGVPAEQGSEMAYVPEVSFNLFTTYRFPIGLTIGGGANHESGHYHNQTGGFLFVSGATSQIKYVENAAAIQEFTKFWTFNAMASYAVHKHFELQVNLTNLTNTKYADRSYDRHFLPGQIRQLLFTPVISW